MEEMACLWSYQQNVEDLKQKLLCTSLELEQLEMQSAEENRRNKGYIKQLLQLVELAVKERDEAKEQLQNLMNKIMPSSDFITMLPSPTTTYNNPMIKPTAKPNSSISESNSLTGNGDSFLDGVSSPDFSNVNVNQQQPFVQGSNNIDQESLLIDTMVQGKTLPQKGKLLKAVLDAGPLLQNLLVAGPLPTWRNPPTVNQTFRIPPVSIKGCDVEAKNGNFPSNLSPIASRSMSSSRPYGEMMCSSQNFSNCFMNFGNGGYGSYLGGGDRVIAPNNNSNTANNSFVPLGKRQRLC